MHDACMQHNKRTMHEGLGGNPALNPKKIFFALLFERIQHLVLAPGWHHFFQPVFGLLLVMNWEFHLEYSLVRFRST
jgi:hypothetical protein